MKNVLNKCKQYKGVLVIVFLGLAFLVYYFSNQPSNVFDEIYSDEIAYLKSSFLVQHFSSMPNVSVYANPTTSDFKAGSISASYKNRALPVNARILVTSNKGSGMRILYWEDLEDKIELNITLDYNPKTKVLKRNVYIKDNYE